MRRIIMYILFALSVVIVITATILLSNPLKRSEERIKKSNGTVPLLFNKAQEPSPLLPGTFVTVENVGNITYGYLGAAAGMSHSWMNFGSSFNHFFKHGVTNWDNERADQSFFGAGINWYTTGVMK